MVTMLHIILITIGSTAAVPKIACNRLKIGDHWYNRNILWGDTGRPYNLNIHKASNIIFFGYSVSDAFLDADFQLAYFNVDTKDFHIIAGIKGGCAVTIDQANDEIYLGGTDGIFKFNMDTKLADFYTEKGRNIWSLFFKNNLFYVSYPNQRLHLEVDGKSATVREFEQFEVDYFHISSVSNNIFFANKTGFYRFDNAKLEAIVLNELVKVRQIVEDNNGNIYITSNFGVYIVDLNGINKILDLRNINGLAFDRDNNFIYSDEKNIVKLTYSVVGCKKNNYSHR